MWPTQWKFELKIPSNYQEGSILNLSKVKKENMNTQSPVLSVFVLCTYTLNLEWAWSDNYWDFKSNNKNKKDQVYILLESSVSCSNQRRSLGSL
jgi:hypothetical protein